MQLRQSRLCRAKGRVGQVLVVQALDTKERVLHAANVRGQRHHFLLVVVGPLLEGTLAALQDELVAAPRVGRLSIRRHLELQLLCRRGSLWQRERRQPLVKVVAAGDLLNALQQRLLVGEHRRVRLLRELRQLHGGLLGLVDEADVQGFETLQHNRHVLVSVLLQLGVVAGQAENVLVVGVEEAAQGGLLLLDGAVLAHGLQRARDTAQVAEGRGRVVSLLATAATSCGGAVFALGLDRGLLRGHKVLALSLHVLPRLLHVGLGLPEAGLQLLAVGVDALHQLLLQLHALDQRLRDRLALLSHGRQHLRIATRRRDGGVPEALQGDGVALVVLVVLAVELALCADDQGLHLQRKALQQRRPLAVEAGQGVGDLDEAAGFRLDAGLELLAPHPLHFALLRGHVEDDSDDDDDGGGGALVADRSPPPPHR
eukprot:m.140344 g.140344  ORF g.140344 m.140344 type:complete len:428 (+) comp16668_c1_seq3:985-2268(+)